MGQVGKLLNDRCSSIAWVCLNILFWFVVILYWLQLAEVLGCWLAVHVFFTKVLLRQ